MNAPLIDFSSKWVPVPVTSVQIIYNTTPDKPNDLLVMVPVQQLAQAPNFDKDNLPDQSNPDWDAKLRTFWGNIQ